MPTFRLLLAMPMHLTMGKTLTVKLTPLQTLYIKPVLNFTTAAALFIQAMASSFTLTAMTTKTVRQAVKQPTTPSFTYLTVISGNKSLKAAVIAPRTRVRSSLVRPSPISQLASMPTAAAMIPLATKICSSVWPYAIQKLPMSFVQQTSVQFSAA